jgi:acetyl esterase/lipase
MLTRPLVQRPFFRAFVTVALVFLFGTLACADDLVIFRDGFAIRGKIKQEMTNLYEGGSVVPIPKNAIFKVDDGARLMLFSSKQVGDKPERKPPPAGADPLTFERKMIRLDNWKMPPGVYAGITPWDAKWDRIIKYDSATRGKIQIKQHLSILTPHYVRIDARQYSWDPCYLTREFNPAEVRQLLLNHPDLKMTGDSKDARKRMRLFYFFAQAGLYEEAAKELDGIQKDFPGEKERVDKARQDLQRALADQYLELIETANKSGRHLWAQAVLNRFPRKDTDESLLTRVRALEATYDAGNQNLTFAQRSLQELLGQVTDTALRGFFREVIPVILTELNFDTVPRLENYISFAQQAERERQQHRIPGYSPEQLLSMAITSWVLGNASAEGRPDAASRLWRTRRFVLDYQRTNGKDERDKKLAQLKSQAGVAIDEMAQLIRALPPPDPQDVPGVPVATWVAAALPSREALFFWGLVTTQKLLPGVPLELRADLPWNFRKGPTYLLQLPPEYHPGRAYPVLFVLHGDGETPSDMLARWSSLAMQHGYLLVSPEWQLSRASGYTYSTEEQRAVFDVLRDLRQHFWIDTDRVFVAGLGEGGNMAYDVGLSHPDLFAGIIPIGGRPRYFAKHYRNNAQYLAFYSVEGDAFADVNKDTRAQFEFWIARGFPCIDVQYKGRGLEWFGAELPYIFDWMNRKKRAPGFPELGKNGNGGVAGQEFQSMRPTDNRFYWLSGDDISSKSTNSMRGWSSRVLPALLQGAIGSGNQINISGHGYKAITVWLGPGMIDFDKPVNIYVNVHLGFGNRKITPNVATLLEDFYERGDRQRLFYAKVELPL